MHITINSSLRQVPEKWRNEKLLFVLREGFGLVGAKFGCGAGQCGACTVHVNGQAERSCLLDVADLVNANIKTIEGLAESDGNIHPVQQAWIDENVPQCGYCQAGQIMSATALLNTNPSPSEDEIDEAMSGNLCRCGTYQRIRKAILRASEGGQ